TGRPEFYPASSGSRIIRNRQSCDNSVNPTWAESMSAKIIDGKALAEQIKGQIRGASDALAAAGKRRPGLAVIMVGDSAASEVYVRNKRRSCEQTGIVSSAHDLPASTSEAELLAL